MASANNTLDESIALITAGNMIVQNPEKVGTALQTLSLRLRSTSAEIEQMGENTEGALETTSKLRQLLLDLTDQKVDIQLDEDTYKSTYQIMLEMSKVMDDMTDMEKATALEAMFGKRQANVGTSILQNMAEAEDVLATSLDSAGSAMEEQEQYQKGIQYSLDRLKASMQELASTTLDSSTIKFFVDLLNGVVNVTSAVGGLVPIMITLGILLPALKASFGTLNLSLIATQVQVFGLGTAFKTLIGTITTFLATNPVGWVLLLGTAVFGVKKIYDHFNVTLEEQQEILSQQAQAYDDATANVKSLEGELESTRLKLEELNAIGGASVVKDGEQERLEAQTEELQRQLDIEKEKQRIAAEEAEKTAVKTLTEGINSEFPDDFRENIHGFGTKGADNKALIQVTRDTELQRAIDKYDELSQKHSELEKKQQDLANSGKGSSKQFSKNADELEYLNTRMTDIRKYANELATDLETEAESITGVTEAGKKQKTIVNTVLDLYTSWIDKINGITSANTDLSDTSDDVVDAMSDSDKALEAQNKAIDEYQESISLVGKALSDFKNLDSSSIIDIMQKFGDFNWAKYGVTGAKGVGNLEDALRDLAKKLLEGVGEIDGFNDALQSMYDEAINTADGTNTLTDAISDLSTFANDMKALDTAYAKIAGGEKIDSSDIVALQEAFGDTINFENFLNAINDVNKITPQVQQAFNNLTTEFVHTSGVLDNLTDENIDLVIAQLELEGVTNANAIATERLALQKEYLAATGKNLADATFDEIVEFARLETTSDNTRIAIANLAQQKIKANNIALMVDGDIKSLRNLMAALGATTNALSLYNTVKSRGYVPGMPSSDYSKYLKSLLYSAQSEVDSFFNSLNGRNSNSSKTAYASPTAKKNTGKNQKQEKGREDNTDYYLEAFERELTELQYKRDKDIVSEKQYLDSLNNLNNKYFKGKSKYLDQYRKYEVEVYQGLKKLEEQRLSDIQGKYDDRLAVIKNSQEEIQHQIDLLESQGNLVGVGFYNQLISNTQQQIKLLNQEKSEIQSLFNKQLSSGFIKSGTDEYYDFIQALNDVDSKIRDLTLQTVNWGKAIEDIVVNAFDDLIDNIEHLNSELSVLYDMLGNKKLTDEVGFTKEGIASIGLLAQQIEASQFKIKEYSDEIERLSKNYAENEERIEELKEAQWDEVRTTQSLRDAIVDLNRERVKSIEEGLKKEYDAYQKIIQAKKDALDSEKSLHDYQNSIAEKEKDVVSLRRQLTTLELDDSDEARTRSALLREELVKAEKALQEEQYNHSIDKQKEALDKELEDYQAQIDEKMLTLEEYLENENQVIADSLELAKSNATSVASVIADLAIEHGIEVSNAVVNPWLQGANAIASYGDALSALTSSFTSQLSKMAAEMDKLLKQANQASKVTVSTPKPTPAPAPKPAPKPSTSSSSSPKPSSSSSSSNKKSLPLARVRYTGNKRKLNKETSIVDKTLSTLNTLNCGKLLRAFNY